MSTSHPFVNIDLSALVANYNALAGSIPNSAPGAAVKCNAYGLGLGPVSLALAERAGCQRFFVAYAEVGQTLRTLLSAQGFKAEIFIFNGPTTETLSLFKDYQLTPILNSVHQAEIWAEAFPDTPSVLHVDTGMNRLGVRNSDLGALQSMSSLSVEMVMTHLACGSDPTSTMTDRQRESFEAAANHFPHAKKSFAASAGALLGEKYGFDVARFGISLYGASPFADPDPRLTPVAQLMAPILQLWTAPAGETVGYDATHTLKRESRLATVGLGYGDGYLRSLSDKGAAVINDQRVPILGRVSMDLITLDLTDLKGDVNIGQPAEFFGPNLLIEDVAATAGSIPHELLTNLGGRIEKRYHS
ncbi:MAG: alanine racemase [Pseudomonadota bacterium]